jgi:hypothetical protein
MIIGGSLLTNKFYLAEINLATSSANQRYYFADIPSLRYGTIEVECISIFNASQLSLSPAGATVVPSTALPGLTLTLCIEDQEESIYNLPTFDLNPSSNGGMLRLFNNPKVNLVKSFVTITNTALVTATHSVLVGFHYKPTGRAAQSPVRNPSTY